MIRFEDVNEGNWRIPLAVADEQMGFFSFFSLYSGPWGIL